MATRIDISANLVWALGQDRKTGHLIAECPPLRIAMGGADQEELEANIKETLQLFFSSLLSDGEFDSFLLKHGWTATPRPPADEVAPESLEFHVPFELVARGSDGLSRAAH